MLFLKEDMDNAVNGRLFPDREEDDKITNGPTVTLGGQLDTQDMDDQFLRDFLDSKYKNKLIENSFHHLEENADKKLFDLINSQRCKFQSPEHSTYYCDSIWGFCDANQELTYNTTCSNLAGAICPIILPDNFQYFMCEPLTI